MMFFQEISFCFKASCENFLCQKKCMLLYFDAVSFYDNLLLVKGVGKVDLVMSDGEFLHPFSHHGSSGKLPSTKENFHAGTRPIFH